MGKPEEIAAALDAAIRASGMKAKVVAERIGISDQTLSRYRKGGIVPSPGRLLQLERALGLTPGSLGAGTVPAERPGPVIGDRGLTLDALYQQVVAAIDAKAQVSGALRFSEVLGWIERMYDAGLAEAERRATEATEAADMHWRKELADALALAQQTQQAAPPRRRAR